MANAYFTVLATRKSAKRLPRTRKKKAVQDKLKAEEEAFASARQSRQSRDNTYCRQYTLRFSVHMVPLSAGVTFKTRRDLARDRIPLKFTGVHALRLLFDPLMVNIGGRINLAREADAGRQPRDPKECKRRELQMVVRLHTHNLLLDEIANKGVLCYHEREENERLVHVLLELGQAACRGHLAHIVLEACNGAGLGLWSGQGWSRIV